jgi:hypothetical protein
VKRSIGVFDTSTSALPTYDNALFSYRRYAA